jgi:hypothetical protein
MEVSDQLQAPAALTKGKDPPPYMEDRKLGGLQDGPRLCGEERSLLCFRISDFDSSNFWSAFPESTELPKLLFVGLHAQNCTYINNDLNRFKFGKEISPKAYFSIILM